MDRTKLCPLGKEVVLARLPLLAPNEQSFILLAILPRPALKPAANDPKINEAECRRKEKIRAGRTLPKCNTIFLALLVSTCFLVGMKKTAHYKGHRWTTEELRDLMQRWAAKESLSDIATALNVTTFSVLKMVGRLRQNGVPLERRNKGHVAGRSNKLWTQGEVEYLLRRRNEKATTEEIAVELGRTVNAVFGMIQKLRTEDVPVAMRGHGVRRLWNADALKALHVQLPESPLIEMMA